MRTEIQRNKDRSGGRAQTARALLNGEDFDAILLDLDGVLTRTANIHAEAWKEMFDAYLRERITYVDGTFKPFDLRNDYRRYVDGKPRDEGVASFLQSRDIYLPVGKDLDSSDVETIRGLGNRKNMHFRDLIRKRGVDVFPSSLEFVQRARAAGFKVAVVTASRNCDAVLKAAGMSDLFDAKVDGNTARKWLLDGKPAPDTFLEAAHRLDVTPDRTVVIEDALPGVRAGKAGDFGLVVGVDRDGLAESMRRNGADVVVSDLCELELCDQPSVREPVAPLAIECLDEIQTRLQGRNLAIFLDYDGTLTPIVDRPELAQLSADMRSTLRNLARHSPVIIVSGRGRSDVEGLVGLDGIIYAGCHGFDISGPTRVDIEHEVGAGFKRDVAAAAHELAEQLALIDGVIVENKTFGVAVHYRLVDDSDVDRIEWSVNGTLKRHPRLRGTRGKKVFELLPNLKWDKGAAVLWLIDALHLDLDGTVPLYIGDDVTDHDAFRALHDDGISILVSDEPADGDADYRLTDVDQVGTFLEKIAEFLDGDKQVE